jgi:tetratricopeptide (TPR) repeat protein
MTKFNSIIWYVLPFVFFLVGCPSEDAPPVDPTLNPDEFIDSGWTKFQQKSYEDALDDFNRAIDISPENLVANLGKSWCIIMLDPSEIEFEEIETTFEKGLEDSVGFVDAYCGLTFLMFIQNKYSLAITYSDSVFFNDESYSFQYDPEIDINDVLLIKAQSQFLSLSYQDANFTLSQIHPSLFLDYESDSWEIDGVVYNSFETALAMMISKGSIQFDSGGFISKP